MAQLPMESMASRSSDRSSMNKRNKFLVPFILVVSLFFLWGMVHNLDSILIPHLKKACELNNRQSTLIDTSVYLAYFLMAIPAGIVLKKWGYKWGIIGGLLVATIGALLFYPAADSRSYELFLVALFIIGCGIAVLETAANPYAAVLGPQETAGIRLNLAAAFNGSAAYVASLVGRYFILSNIEHTKEQLAAMPPAEKLAYLNYESSAVKGPYLVLAGGFLLVALLFSFFHFPEVKSETKKTRLSEFPKAFRHRHLSWAVFAQFVYVGAQVCITSFFIRAVQQVGSYDEDKAVGFLGVYGLLFMVGRFAGTFFLKFVKQQKLLTLYAIICTLLCAVAILAKGDVVVYALCGLGFFVSIMFPTIFALGIIDLGEDTKIGSSLLIMSIIGGAIFPYLMGTIVDMSHDKVQPGYIVPLVCFLVIIYFGISGYKIRQHEKPVELG